MPAVYSSPVENRTRRQPLVAVAKNAVPTYDGSMHGLAITLDLRETYRQSREPALLRVGAHQNLYLILRTPSVRFRKVNVRGSDIRFKMSIAGKRGTLRGRARLSWGEFRESVTYEEDPAGDHATFRAIGSGAPLVTMDPLHLAFDIGPPECRRLEVLYVGQTRARKPGRSVFERLDSHETLQRIYADHLDAGHAVLIGLVDISEVITVSGIADPLSQGGRPDQLNMMDWSVDHDDLRRQDIIDVCEGGLVAYFKPVYNRNLKHTFPDSGHRAIRRLSAHEIGSIFTALRCSPWKLWSERRTASALHVPYARVGSGGILDALTDPPDSSLLDLRRLYQTMLREEEQDVGVRTVFPGLRRDMP